MNARFPIFLGLLMVCDSALALSEHYTCEVKQVMQLDNAGRFSKPSQALGMLVGESFVVNRATGKLDGNVSWFKTSQVERVEVISGGKTQNNFRSMSIGRPPTSRATYIYVQEVAAGTLKPFYVADENLIISGTCK